MVVPPSGKRQRRSPSFKCCSAARRASRADPPPLYRKRPVDRQQLADHWKIEHVVVRHEPAGASDHSPHDGRVRPAQVVWRDDGGPRLRDVLQPVHVQPAEGAVSGAQQHRGAGDQQTARPGKRHPSSFILHPSSFILHPSSCPQCVRAASSCQHSGQLSGDGAGVGPVVAGVHDNPAHGVGFVPASVAAENGWLLSGIGSGMWVWMCGCGCVGVWVWMCGCVGVGVGRDFS